MFGYEAEEIIGKSILRLIPEELHPDEARILRTLRAGERIEHYETTRITKRGQRIEVSLTISPIKDKSSNVIGASKIARDITARKKMEHKNNLGNGIGLWIAQQLTEKHGGRIAITSSTQAGNSGTHVLIFLPFANPCSIQDNV